MSKPSSPVVGPSAPSSSASRAGGVRAAGTPQLNRSIPHHHANLSDSHIALHHVANSVTAAAAAAQAHAHGGMPQHPLPHAHPLMSAPSRGAGLWANGSGPAAAAAVAPAASGGGGSGGGAGLVFPLVRPSPMNDVPGAALAGSLSHHSHLNARRAAPASSSSSGNAWTTSPASHLPPRTKIICTIGPASHSPDKMRAMLMAGMNVARLNFSHGDYDFHRASIQNLRDVMQDTRRICALLLDTKGPEIRTGRLSQNVGVGATLVRDQEVTLCTDESVLCDSKRISVGYAQLPKIVRAGSHILIDDGLVDLLVLETLPAAGEVRCRVLNNATLGAHKGVNLPGIAIDLPAVTQKDVSDIKLAMELGLDFIAASFVRRASDVTTIRKILGSKGSGIKIIAKIESQEGLDNFDSILQVADGIMVARGDLGVEIPLEQVALAQKMMIRACNMAGKPVIVATQMLDSMCVNPSPTRAEASDVANAVLDGSDAVMLSGETARGRYPVESVQMMADICREAEASINHAAASQALRDDLRGRAVSVTEAIASSSVRATFDLRAAVIVVLTETGTTARLVAKYRPLSPIITVTSSEQTARQSLVSRGLFPLLVGSMVGSDSLINRVLLAATRLGLCSQGDLAVVTSGSREATAGATNDMKVVCVAT